jgi:DNA-binding NarL/FixJ family response regulator
MTVKDHHDHSDSLFERDRELAALDRLIEEAAGGHGRLALVEGPAGIGKTRLLAEARARAAKDGRMTVLHARCSELEREFSFGAVRQLFESAGASAPAAQPSSAREDAAADADGEGQDEGSFAALHSLHWAILELAEQRPLLLAIDDVQWSDVPSLRFIAYLAHRVKHVPVLLVLTLRSTDPGTDPGLINSVTTDPLCESIRPAPLGGSAVTAYVEAWLGPAHPDFLAACETATGGNPLLLRQLMTALADDDVKATAASAGAVRRIGSRAIARTVLSRLARLPADALVVARAVATLGQSSSTATLSAFTGLDEAAVASATTALARADILRPDVPIRFVHPLVRDAVYHDVAADDPELAHARAAELLTAAGAGDEDIAAQLVPATRCGSPRTVALLRAAARHAQRSGAPESAVTYLERALEEPPPANLLATVQFELGLAAWDRNAPTAARHLRAAYRELEDPFQRATAGQALAKALLFTVGPQEALQLVQEVVDELPSALEDERHGMESMEILTVVFGGDPTSALARVDAYERLPPNAGFGSRCLAAAVSFMWCLSERPSADSEALLLAALDDGALLESADGFVWSYIAMTFHLCGSARTSEFFEQARTIAYRRGSLFVTSSMEQWRGLHLLSSDLPEAGEALGQAVSLQRLWETDLRGGAWARAYLCRYSLAVGDVDGARAALGPEPYELDTSDGANAWRTAAAELALTEDRWQDALTLATRVQHSAPHVLHPDWKSWRPAAAQALAGLGRHDEALATMQDELAAAHSCASPATVGRCLRQLGQLEGERGEAHLREAVATLEATPARLELAHALIALGRLLAPDSGDGADEAVALLRRGRDLATACGSPPLVAAAEQALAARGEAPATASGTAALTARERRVTELVSNGHSDRDIARELLITPAAVDRDLAAAYAKLDVHTREELPHAIESG